MINAVIKILNNSELRNSMSREARRKAEEFDWLSIAKQTEQLYNKLLPKQ
jgi:glycosyltransferase involved in cell wall biosynthesis